MQANSALYADFIHTRICASGHKADEGDFHISDHLFIYYVYFPGMRYDSFPSAYYFKKNRIVLRNSVDNNKPQSFPFLKYTHFHGRVFIDAAVVAAKHQQSDLT